MASQNKRITLTVTLLVAIAAMFAGLFVSQHIHWKKEIDPSQFHGTFLQKPRDIEQFSLTGIDQQSFDNHSLQGQWTMIFFGFTNCGYVCPTTMAELAKMYGILEQQHTKPLPRVVMVSVDPERDDLNTLKNYVLAFNPHFYGARGEQQAVKKMAMEMGIAYEKKISGNPDNYDVQHSGAVMLFNPQGELSAFFTTPHRAELLAKDYQLLVG
ncbi:SCO1/SenC family transporter protein [Legionella birminghamensis]|uniref:SCO1/SenC family protein n=1 Tax=Legionella birminghamensis TaxID=28083 RepID=A0A378I7X4_9GAMM|nr:SCO family protein [Legionella birminghamensis]KTC68147.1 SCO1/SenC family transporter protein [Legionella birminghamensis]STX31143.1 SCO1/SenC family protein [Legionella birminghamensis]